MPNTTAFAVNYVGDKANNSVFFFIVPPGAEVVEYGVFVAYDQYPPYFHVDRGKTSDPKDVALGPARIYATWDDVGAQKYEVVAGVSFTFEPIEAPYDYPGAGWAILLAESPRRIEIFKSKHPNS